jgi:TetR/AcrR family transcriptional regulator, regulator of autoinduction and epiphytic fitness
LNICLIVRYGSVNTMTDAAPHAPEKKAVEKPRRVRRDPEAARRLILDAAEQVMRDEGYAAVSTRRVAKDAGLAPALVHYYYPLTDDMFVALHQRMTDRQVEDLRAIMAAENPVQALWNYQTAWTSASLGVEFMALANHRKSIREKIARRTEQARMEQAELLARHFRRSCALPEAVTPASLAAVLTGLARTIVNEQSIGITCGHDGVRALVDWAIDLLTNRPGR